MTYRHVFRLTCDVPGCPSWRDMHEMVVEPLPDPPPEPEPAQEAQEGEPTLAEHLLARALFDGWIVSHEGKRHYCPTHNPIFMRGSQPC